MDTLLKLFSALKNSLCVLNQKKKNYIVSGPIVEQLTGLVFFFSFDMW